MTLTPLLVFLSNPILFWSFFDTNPILFWSFFDTNPNLFWSFFDTNPNLFWSFLILTLTCFGGKSIYFPGYWGYFMLERKALAEPNLR